MSHSKYYTHPADRGCGCKPKPPEPEPPPPPPPPPPPTSCNGCSPIPDPVLVEISGSFIPDCNGIYPAVHDGTPTCYWNGNNTSHPRSNVTVSWNGIYWSIAHGGDCYCGVTEIISADCHVGGSVGGCWGGTVTLTP